MADGQLPYSIFNQGGAQVNAIVPSCFQTDKETLWIDSSNACKTKKCR